MFGVPAGGGAVQLGGTRPPGQLDTLPSDDLKQVGRRRQQPMPPLIVQRPGTRIHGFAPLTTQLVGQREFDLGVAGTERALPGGEIGGGLAQPGRGLRQVTGDDGGLADGLQTPRRALSVAAGATAGEAVQAVPPAALWSPASRRTLPRPRMPAATPAASPTCWNSRMASRKRDRLVPGRSRTRADRV